MVCSPTLSSCIDQSVLQTVVWHAWQTVVWHAWQTHMQHT
jgi:hypothetical protein